MGTPVSSRYRKVSTFLSTPRVTLADCGSSRVPALREQLISLGARVRTVALPGAKDADWSTADAVVISGGPRLFTKNPQQREFLGRQFSFLTKLHSPVLGVCLGHQALGLVAGAEPYRGPERREPEDVEWLEDHALFDGLPNPCRMAEDHTEGVPLPRGYRALARTACYSNEAMVSNDGCRLGVQFHPESSGEPGRRLLGNFLEWAARLSRTRPPPA